MPVDINGVSATDFPVAAAAGLLEDGPTGQPTLGASAATPAPGATLNCDPDTVLCQSCCWPYAFYNCAAVLRTAKGEHLAACWPYLSAIPRTSVVAFRDGRRREEFRIPPGFGPVTTTRCPRLGPAPAPVIIERERVRAIRRALTFTRLTRDRREILTTQLEQQRLRLERARAAQERRSQGLPPLVRVTGCQSCCYPYATYNRDQVLRSGAWNNVCFGHCGGAPVLHAYGPNVLCPKRRPNPYEISAARQQVRRAEQILAPILAPEGRAPLPPAEVGPPGVPPPLSAAAREQLRRGRRLLAEVIQPPPGAPEVQ